MLSGDIGSGKSTILLSIEFALFGIRRGLFSGVSLLRHDAREGSVELTFLISGQEVIVKRTLKRGKDSVNQSAGYIVIGGRKYDLAPTELNSKICSLLGYPEENLAKGKELLFRFTVYTPQEQMKQIILEDSEIRLATLRTLFGIDRYKTIRDNSVIYTRELKQRNKLFEGICKDLPEKEKMRNEKAELLTTVAQKLEQIRPLHTVKRAQLIESEQKLSELEKKQSDLFKISKEHSANIARISGFVNNIDSLAKKQTQIDAEINSIKLSLTDLSVDEKMEPSYEESVNQISEKINSVSNNKKIVVQNIAFLKNRINELQKEITEKTYRVSGSEELISNQQKLNHVVSEKKSIDEQRALLEKNIAQFTAAVNTSNIRIFEAEKMKVKVASLENCPFCFQNVGLNHKEHIRSNKDIEISAAKVELGKNSVMLKSMQTEYLSVVEKQKRLIDAEKGLAVIANELKSNALVKAELDKKQIVLSKSQEKLNEFILEEQKLSEVDVIALQKHSDELKKIIKNILIKKQLMISLADKQKILEGHIIEKKKLEQELKICEEKKESVQDKILLLDSVSKELAFLRQVIVKNREEERTASENLLRLSKELEFNSLILRTLDEDVIRKKDVLSQLNGNVQLIQWLEDKFIALMYVLEKQVMVKIHHEFNDLFKEWYSMLIEDETLQAFIDDDFTPRIVQNGYDCEIENLSGGERTSLALAYRLALNRVVNDVVASIKTKDILILDEPTDGFSTEQLDKVRDVLNQLSANQIIIVSHENKIESFADSIIRIGKRGGISVVE